MMLFYISIDPGSLYDYSKSCSYLGLFCYHNFNNLVLYSEIQSHTNILQQKSGTLLI